MSFTFKELIQRAEPATEFVKKSLELATSLGLETLSWQPVDPELVIIRIVAEALSALSSIAEAIIRGGFLDTAEGQFLVDLAREVFGVVVSDGTYAAGTYTLTNAGNDIHNIGVGALRVQNPATLQNYRNTSAGTLSPGGTLTLDIVAEQAGASATSLAGTITTLVTTYIGVTGTNPNALIGSDRPSDASIRDLCRLSLASLSPNGPRDAYAYAARSATDADGLTLGVTRVNVVPGFPVQVYLATANGAPSVDVVNAVDAAIQTSVVPDGHAAETYAATNVSVAVTATLHVDSRTTWTDVDLIAEANEAATAFFPEYPVGGRKKSGVPALWIDDLAAKISESSSEVFSVTMTAPLTFVSATPQAVFVPGVMAFVVSREVQ